MVGGMRDIFVRLLCDYSRGYVRRVCLFLVGLKDEIFDGFLVF